MALTTDRISVLRGRPPVRAGAGGASGQPIAGLSDHWGMASGSYPFYVRDPLLEQTLRAGRLCRIVVWRLDRLGRTTRGLCQLFEELQENKVDLVSLKDGFFLSSPAGRLHARILASVAEYETEIRAERVHAGQQVARRKGNTWGGSEKGWRWRVTDEQVTAIQEMKAVRTPIAKIARITGLSRPTIYQGTESFDSGGRVTLHDDASNRPMSKYKNWTA